MRKILELVEWQLAVILLGIATACFLIVGGGGGGWKDVTGVWLLTASATWSGLRSGRRAGRRQAHADIAKDLGEGWVWPPTFTGEEPILTFRIDEYPRKDLVVVSSRELRIEDAKKWGWDEDEHSVHISCPDESDAEIADFVSSVLDQPEVKKVMKEGSK